MKSQVAILLLLAAFIIAPAAMAGDFYKWVDDNGEVHFADSILGVPEKHRGQVEDKNFEAPPDKSTVKELSEGASWDAAPGIGRPPAPAGKKIARSGGPVANFTDADFQGSVVEAGGLSMVEFWAVWCGPCLIMAPIIDQLAAEYGGSVNIGKLDIDRNKGTASKYGIKSIPTILFFKNGEALGKTVGVHSKEELARMIEANM